MYILHLALKTDRPTTYVSDVDRVSVVVIRVTVRTAVDRALVERHHVLPITRYQSYTTHLLALRPSEISQTTPTTSVKYANVKVIGLPLVALRYAIELPVLWMRRNTAWCYVLVLLRRWSRHQADDEQRQDQVPTDERISTD